LGKPLGLPDLEEGKCVQSDLFFTFDHENRSPDALETHFWAIFLLVFDSFSWLGDGLQRDLLVTLDRENHSPDAGSTLLHPDLQTVASRQEPNKTPTPTAKHPAPELGAAVLPPLGGIQLNKNIFFSRITANVPGFPPFRPSIEDILGRLS